MSAAGTLSGAGLGRRLALLRRATVYELRKNSVFRTGFIVRELLHGLVKPLALLFLYHAMFASSEREVIRGFSYPELVRYMVLVALVRKLLFHERLLDISRQIFEGYITKYLVMPFDYFLLPLGRFVQFTLVQIAVVLVLWSAGALLLPEWWPYPASFAGVIGAGVLVMLGSYCFFLLYCLVESLAFWLDVVWSLMVMSSFVASFAGGEFLPVAMMPEGLQRVFECLFPYWALGAPVELFLGRLHGGDFLRGLATLCVWIAGLELARRALWRRGTRRYAGSGM